MNASPEIDQSASSGPRPLEGIRVLDLTVALAGPYCTMLLGMMGAEVIRIDAPAGGDLARYSPPFYGASGSHFGKMDEGDLSVSTLLRMRGKKSVTLDLKSPEGKAIFRDLASQSDVVVENMSEGTVDKLGVGYEALKADNPGLVFASISGFGDDHPYPGLKAMDIIVQALSGLMSVTGEKDGPPMRVGISIADLVASNYALTGVLAALVARGRTGTGQHVKVSMLDALSSLVAIEHFDVFKRAGYSNRAGNQLTRLAPFGLFQASDGYVAIAAVADKWVAELFDAMGQPELIEDPRFSSRGLRSNNADELVAEIEAWTSQLPVEAILRELCEKRDVPAARMRTAEEVLNDPFLRASGAIMPLEHPDFGVVDAVGPGMPVKFGQTGKFHVEPSQQVGASTSAVLGNMLGYSKDKLEELKRSGVI